MTNEYAVIIVKCDEKCNEEIRRIIDSLTKSIEAKHGEARIAYQGSEEQYIKTIDSFLDLDKHIKKS